jgi:PKD repeat protein
VTPSFNYGHIDTSTPGVPSDVTDGPADAGSGFATDGTITILLSTSKVGSPVAGQILGGIHGQTQLLLGATRGLLAQIDSTPSGSYTMFGNDHCQSNPAPVAALFDAPSSGAAPLDVTFDASRSSDPGPDSITSYAFNFGDGSSVTQSSPIATHTYKVKGNYTATLVVTNDRQKSSINRAAAGVNVKSPNHPPTAVLNASSRAGTAPMTVGFDGSQSSDPDPGDAIASYTFDFGDGTAPVTSTGASVTHTYQSAGSYTATLVVKNTDGQGSVNNASVTITVNAPLLP